MRDLLNIAATLIEATSPPPRGQMASRAVVTVVMTAVAAFCGIGAVICLVTALWLYEMPMLGEVGAPLLVAAVLAAATLIAGLVLHSKTQSLPPPPPHPLIGLSSVLLGNGAGSLMKSHKTLILMGALLAGFVASESQGRR